tara:strand:+ start:6042 stop:6794 length:753 start_codon:yes stop_codon:yes gene_type:complete
MKPISLPQFTLEKNTLQDQVILITGASRGLGRCLALKVAEYGATTILMGSNLKKLESVYDQIVDNGWVEPALQPINFLGAGPKEIQDISQSVKKMFGRLDGVIHNAAKLGQVCPIANMPPHKWQEAIHVNLNIPFMLTHSLLPLLSKSDKAKIIFTGDMNTQPAQAYWSAYAASKQGVTAISQSLAEELEGTNIQVNCVYPPELRTSLRVNHFPGINPESFIAPESITHNYIYLLSKQCTLHGRDIALSV